ncbi:MAG TPA: IclR family transcriptional regulator [Candidatus Agrococcus pullicola]|uniref:Glycerol operon regulatory protein n=1 Tax=Candidatus Agrococcus pullicola TaxID=2838429 RepID=A0A9D1YV79_9MICO|nr:IclR family transcriptional regulator [Candidatus Agrococcus pullicola]
MSRDTGLVQSVDRAITVLEILARSGASSVSDLARRLDVHKSSVSRLLATLERRGIVEQESDGGRYGLGAGIVRLARSARDQSDVVAVARPVAERLSRMTGETVNVSVIEGNEVVNIEEVNLSDSVLGVSWLGSHTQLHNTANGKVFLAHMSPARANGMLRAELSSATERTVTDPKLLRAQLELIRQQGYAWQREELEPGLTAVAAPVFDASGDALAALSVAGPSFRLTPDREGELTELTKNAAADVSRKLGWLEDARAS